MIKKSRTLALCALALSALSPDVSARELTQYPSVKLQSLDKATARTMTFEAKVGSTLKFGPLYMKVQSCQKSSPIDEPESAAFLQIWEVDTNKESSWVFSGWMFASSPGLSPMDHPIYDVWVIDCLGDVILPSEDEIITDEATVQPPIADAQPADQGDLLEE